MFIDREKIRQSLIDYCKAHLMTPSKLVKDIKTVLTIDMEYRTVSNFLNKNTRTSIGILMIFNKYLEEKGCWTK